MKKSLIALIIITTLILGGCNNVNVQSTNLNNVNTNNIIYNSEILTEEQAETEKNTSDDSIETYEANIKMVGDNILHDSIIKAALQENGEYNFDSLFEHIKDDIEKADIAIINQETIFTSNKDEYSGYPLFGSPVSVGDAIVKAGFNIVAHATNHTLDKDIQGVLDTIDFWETNYPEVEYLGIHKDTKDKDVTYIENNNITFALVNYTYGLNGLEHRRKGNEHIVDTLQDSNVEETLREAEQNADITIALLHIGEEYNHNPSDYTKRQIDKFINNGADIILCTHPHVIQPYKLRTTELGNTALVYYSLGNFMSGQDKIPRVLGGMADITIRKTIENNKESVEIVNYTMIPLVTHQEYNYNTVYKLEDYTDELAQRHKLKSIGINTQALERLWDKIIIIDREEENNDGNN